MIRVLYAVLMSIYRELVKGAMEAIFGAVEGQVENGVGTLRLSFTTYPMG